MYAIQQYSEQLTKNTPANERPQDGVWVTLLTFETIEEAQNVMNRPYSDGRKRIERVR